MKTDDYKIMPSCLRKRSEDISGSADESGSGLDACMGGCYIS